jgi:hypothetical protein
MSDQPQLIGHPNETDTERPAGGRGWTICDEQPRQHEAPGFEQHHY